MSITPEHIKAWIEAGLKDSHAMVSGDGTHFEAIVTCPHFAQKSLIVQHRMVYATLGKKMGDAIHALSLKTQVS